MKSLPFLHQQVLRKIIPERDRFYSKLAEKKNTLAIQASNTQAVVYKYMNSGVPCTCNITDNDPIDEEGHLLPEVAKNIIHGQKLPDNRLEEFEASDNMEDEDEEYAVGGFIESRCGLCFGTGFVGGYLLANGCRKVLTVNDAKDGVTGSRINKLKLPNTVDGITHPLFFIEIPRNEKFVYRLWNQDKVVTDLTPDFPDSDPHRIFGFSFDGEWSHVEIQSVNPSIPVDITDVRTELVSYISQVEATIQVSGKYDIPTFSVVMENRYNCAWQVKQIENVKNLCGDIVYQELTVRKIAENEIHHQLLGVKHNVRSY